MKEIEAPTPAGAGRITREEMELILHSDHADPFQVLGMHEVATESVSRSWKAPWTACADTCGGCWGAWRSCQYSESGGTVEGGRFFNGAGPLTLPPLARVKSDYVVTEGGREYPLDNVETPEREEVEAVWVTEQKNWEKRVGVEAARKFARAVAAYRAERGLKRMVAWLYGRAGFTAAARAFLEREGILYSDQEQLLDLAEELGLVGV